MVFPVLPDTTDQNSTLTTQMMQRLAQMGIRTPAPSVPNPMPAQPSMATARPQQPSGLVGGSEPTGMSGFHGQGIVGSVLNDVFQIKSKMHAGKVNKAAQALYQYLSYKATGNQQAMQQWMQDEKNQKLLSKANDPGTVESQGMYVASIRVQKEQDAQQQRNLTQAQIQEAQNKAKAEQARATAEAARKAEEEQKAEFERKQTEQLGQVTPSQKADIKSKEKIAKMHADAIRDRIDAQLKEQRYRTNKMYDAAMARVKAFQDNIKKFTGNKNMETLTKEYNSLAGQVKNLNQQYGKFQDDIKAHPWKDWLNTKHIVDARRQMVAIDTQRQALETQMQAIEKKRSAMLQVGALPPDAGNLGTETEPIVIDESDMNDSSQEQP